MQRATGVQALGEIQGTSRMQEKGCQDAGKKWEIEPRANETKRNVQSASKGLAESKQLTEGTEYANSKFLVAFFHFICCMNEPEHYKTLFKALRNIAKTWRIKNIFIPCSPLASCLYFSPLVSSVFPSAPFSHFLLLGTRSPHIASRPSLFTSQFCEIF